jgi:hypothetical protein
MREGRVAGACFEALDGAPVAVGDLGEPFLCEVGPQAFGADALADGPSLVDAPPAGPQSRLPLPHQPQVGAHQGTRYEARPPRMIKLLCRTRALHNAYPEFFTGCPRIPRLPAIA